MRRFSVIFSLKVWGWGWAAVTDDTLMRLFTHTRVFTPSTSALTALSQPVILKERQAKADPEPWSWTGVVPVGVHVYK